MPFIFLLLFIFSFEFSFLQAQNFHALSPKNYTQNSLKKILPNETSDFYAILLKPKSCPRCEIMLSPLVKELKEQTKKKVFLFTYYPFGKAFENYVRASNFYETDSLIFDEKIFTLFAFQGFSDYPAVPYLLKFDCHGNLLFQQSLLGLENNETILMLAQRANEKLTINDDYFTPFDTLLLTQQIYLKKVTEITLPAIVESGVFSSLLIDGEKHLFFIDEINEKFICLDLKTNKFFDFSAKELLASHYYPQIDESTMVYLRKNNLIFALFLTIQNLKKEIYISCSAPLLHLDSLERLHYFNQPTWLNFDVKKQSLTVKKANFKHYQDGNLLFSHYTSKLFSKGKNIKMLSKIYKGIPSTGNSFSDSLRVGNPYNRDFYQKIPTWKLLDYPDFTPIKSIGKLPFFSQKNFLGYTYAEPLFYDTKKYIWQYCPTDSYLRSFDKKKYQEKDSILLDETLRVFENVNLGVPKSTIHFFDFAPYYKRVPVAFWKKNKDWKILVENRKNGFFGHEKTYELHLLSACKSSNHQIFTIPDIYQDAKLSNVFISNNTLFCVFRNKNKVLILQD